MTRPSDNELMLKVKEGDVGKLGLLFERYHGKLYGFLVRLTNSKDTSEDLVQEVFFRILRYRTTFRGDAPFTAWMYQLGRNVIADHFRKQKEGAPLSEAEAKSDPDSSPAHILEQIEQNDLLHLALSRLPLDRREVLVLSRFQGMKYEEIGQVLQCPVGTVKAKVHFALKELREIYLNLSEEAIL